MTTPTWSIYLWSYMNCTLVFLHFTYTVLTANEVLIRTFVSRHAHKKQACTHGRAFCINISGGFTFLQRERKQSNVSGARLVKDHWFAAKCCFGTTEISCFDTLFQCEQGQVRWGGPRIPSRTKQLTQTLKLLFLFLQKNMGRATPCPPFRPPAFLSSWDATISNITQWQSCLYLGAFSQIQFSYMHSLVPSSTRLVFFVSFCYVYVLFHLDFKEEKNKGRR